MLTITSDQLRRRIPSDATTIYLHRPYTPTFTMADVEMSDAPGAVAKKAEGSSSKAVEGKKKFEVKKV